MADEPLARVGKGDPITADWANAVADAINGRGASDPNANGTATPYGSMTPADVDTQMRAPDAQAMPFDAAIIREGSDGDALYMALPSGPDYVFYGADAVAPDAAQTMGTALNAWVRIEAVTNNTARYVSLGLTKPQSGSSSSQPPTWRLFVASSPTARPGWADPEKPVVLLAGYNIAADDPSGADTTETDTPSLLKGLVQYHRGTVNLGDGGGDDWLPDSFAEQYLSLDPPSVALIYETEQVQETVTQTYGKGVDGQPLTRQVVVTKTAVKTDADGNPVPATDEQGQPLTTPAMYHQIHNFDSANDGALLELADENGSGGALVCTRATDGAGFAEVKWRRIPRTPPPCIPTYSLDEQAGQGCAEKTIVLKRTDYAKNSAGECVEGATVIVGGGVAVPKPPENTLAASGSCSKTVTLYKTPCGGSATAAGSFSFDVPPTISATSTGNSSGGALAGTVTVTPCGGVAIPINIYNGKDGAQGPQGPQGCSPDISVEQLSPGSAQGGAAGGEKVTITTKASDGQGGCQTDEVLSFVIHNGVDGGGLNDTVVTGLSSLSVTSAGLVLTATTATYTNGVKTGTGTTTVTCPVTNCA